MYIHTHYVVLYCMVGKVEIGILDFDLAETCICMIQALCTNVGGIKVGDLSKSYIN